MKQQIVFPEVSREPEGRPGSCPHCGAAVLRRHQSRPRRLVDLKVQQVHTVQYRCACCGGFVTVRPAGEMAAASRLPPAHNQHGSGG